MNALTKLEPVTIIAMLVVLYFICAILLIFSYLKRRLKNLSMANISERFGLENSSLTGGENLQRKAISNALIGLESYRKKRKVGRVSSMLKLANVNLSSWVFVSGWILTVFLTEVILLFLSVSQVINFLSISIISASPYFILSFRAKRVRQSFTEEFAGAVDMIVRGARSGLSVSGCFKVVADEGPQEVRKHFKKLFNDLDLGLSLSVALERFSDRIGLPEVRFFAMVVSVQSTSGGSLTGALENLSVLLRERKLLKGKVQTLSSEAKTSAWIIGSLPIIVLAVVQVMSPESSAVLFETSRGQLILGAASIWMMIGVFVMSRMIDLGA